MLKMFNAGLLCLLFYFSLLGMLLPLFALPASAQGVYEAWVARYNGGYANALAIDDSGNVYVTGVSWGTGTGSDYATIKYAPTNGDTVWVRRYNDPTNGDDGARALAVDASGNVYVTGYSQGIIGNGTIYGYATIKYNSFGDTLWVRIYDGQLNGDDGARALAVDASGNVYVTGYNYRSYATIKYSSSGDLLWVRNYKGPGGGYDYDYATALAVDDSGNVYVTGYSYGSDISSDYATIKYSSSGDTLWVRRYDGSGNVFEGNRATALAIDDSENVYVTGYSWDSSTSQDYATIKYSSSGDTLWVRKYNGPPGNGDDGATALTADDSGNVYVTGYSYGSGTYNNATIKYNSFGDTLWVRRYGGGVDTAYSLAIDDSRNVYVTGSSYRNYATIKYSSAGDTLWLRSYNGPSADGALAIAVDDSGNVYVTGYSGGDYATIKYSPCSAKPGDATGDGLVRLSDIIGIINYLYKGQAAPNPVCRGDADGNGSILLPDIIYLINSIFKSGPAPVISRECCL